MAGIGDYAKGKKFTLTSGNTPDKESFFKMGKDDESGVPGYSDDFDYEKMMKDKEKDDETKEKLDENLSEILKGIGSGVVKGVSKDPVADYFARKRG